MPKTLQSFSSGVEAITVTLSTLVSSGDDVVSTMDLYGGILEFFRNILPKFGGDVSLVKAADFDEMMSGIRKRALLLGL